MRHKAKWSGIKVFVFCLLFVVCCLLFVVCCLFLFVLFVVQRCLLAVEDSSARGRGRDSDRGRGLLEFFLLLVSCIAKVHTEEVEDDVFCAR